MNTFEEFIKAANELHMASFLVGLIVCIFLLNWRELLNRGSNFVLRLKGRAVPAQNGKIYVLREDWIKMKAEVKIMDKKLDNLEAEVKIMDSKLDSLKLSSDKLEKTVNTMLKSMLQNSKSKT